MALVSILFLYAGIGVLAALGTVSLTQTRFSPDWERRFYALLLIPIAGIYLAFISYFQAPAAVSTELAGIGGFVLLALLGLRLPVVIAVGYALHGAWDLAHEIVAHGLLADSGALTSIPLAYGVFCAAYDWCIAGYILRQRVHWTPRGL